ncbi:hypothetical protein O181_062182 [Austropuccinia psidii MF-1]|uniref:Uncharacterized protein n=1 Tax=Austropuccinia psidii MF-1 TaxID=1389203 RepID=A0A9Q3ERS6_9BASI|nr:hypothetical protein [Austropuccinia psidii MF-1]
MSKSNPAYDSEVASKIPIHFMEIDRRKSFKFSEWESESDKAEPEGTETPILNEFFISVTKTYSKHKQCSLMLQLLQQKYRSPELELKLEEPWLGTIRIINSSL